MSASNLYLVIYRRPGGNLDLREITSNVAATVAILQAQGYIIIDVIDIGCKKD